MVSFSIDFKPSAEKDLRRLPRTSSSAKMEKIENLKSDPFPSQFIRISGSERLYRLRVGDYRITTKLIPKQKRSPSITFVPEALHIAIFEACLDRSIE
jgi:mRNA interferase RelE/StbE